MQFSVLSVELTLITPTQYLYISVLLSLLLPLLFYHICTHICMLQITALQLYSTFN